MVRFFNSAVVNLPCAHHSKYHKWRNSRVHRKMFHLPYKLTTNVIHANCISNNYVHYSFKIYVYVVHHKLTLQGRKYIWEQYENWGFSFNSSIVKGRVECYSTLKPRTFKTKIALLRYNIEKWVKEPDSGYLKPLLGFTILKTEVQLRILTGFFAYYAKWIHNYANKVKPPLDTQKENYFRP